MLTVLVVMVWWYKPLSKSKEAGDDKVGSEHGYLSIVDIVLLTSVS